MQSEDLNLSRCLIAVENAGRSLDETLEAGQQQQQRVQEQLGEVLAAIDRLRSAAAAEAKRAERMWAGLLALADRCFATDDASPAEVRDWLASLFESLGYTLYGMCGTTADSLERYDVMGKSQDSRATAGVIVQVLAIGLMRNDGSVVRLAKVVLTA